VLTHVARGAFRVRARKSSYSFCIIPAFASASFVGVCMLQFEEFIDGHRCKMCQTACFGGSENRDMSHMSHVAIPLKLENVALSALA
jgi:hypothetical protein